MKNLMLGFVILLCTKAIAQPDPIGTFNKHVIEAWTEEYIHVSQYKVKGSPYFLGESFQGDFTVKSGILATNKKIFYDIYSQKMGVDLNKEFIKPDEEVQTFYLQLPDKFGGERLNFINGNTLPKADAKGFYNVLLDGSNVMLLKQFKNRLVPDPQNMYSKDFRIFEQYYDYYIFNKKTSLLEKVRLKEKDILSAVAGLPTKNIDAAAAGQDLSTLVGLKLFVSALNTSN